MFYFGGNLAVENSFGKKKPNEWCTTNNSLETKIYPLQNTGHS